MGCFLCALQGFLSLSFLYSREFMKSVKLDLNIYHTCDKFQRGIRELFLSFPGGFLKLYGIYENILHSFRGDFKILVKSDIF